MKEYFTIGETARLNNISIQTLRYHEGSEFSSLPFRHILFSPREEIRRVMNMEKQVLELIRGIHL